MIRLALTSIVLQSVFVGQTMSQELPPPMSPPYPVPPPYTLSGEGGPPPMILSGASVWREDPLLRQSLQLSKEQSRKVESIVRDQQIQDIDLRADVEKQGALLDALMESDAPDKAQVFAQMDKLSDARARFEKSHVETLFAIYDVLTPEQAKRLRNILPRSMMLRLGFLPPVASPPPGGPRLTEP